MFAAKRTRIRALGLWAGVLSAAVACSAGTEIAIDRATIPTGIEYVAFVLEANGEVVASTGFRELDDGPVRWLLDEGVGVWAPGASPAPRTSDQFGITRVSGSPVYARPTTRRSSANCLATTSYSPRTMRWISKRPSSSVIA